MRPGAATRPTAARVTLASRSSEGLVLTHGAGDADYAVLNVSNQARVSIGGADVSIVSVCKMIFCYGTTKSNDSLKRVRDRARQQPAGRHPRWLDPGRGRGQGQRMLSHARDVQSVI